jgi:RimJ/RimL family protein N-acetyltransferase
MLPAPEDANSRNPHVKAPDRLESERLLLRRPTVDDAQSIFERYANDAEVMRYLAWPRHQSIEQTLAFLTFSDSEWNKWPAGPYLIESRATGTLLGSTGFSFESPEEAATGYVLARDAWGRGYATEALATLMGLCEQLGLRRVYALCHAGHSASQRVLQKCGFELEASAHKQFDFPNLGGGAQPVVCYAKSVRSATS